MIRFVVSALLVVSMISCREVAYENGYPSGQPVPEPDSTAIDCVVIFSQTSGKDSVSIAGSSNQLMGTVVIANGCAQDIEIRHTRYRGLDERDIFGGKCHHSPMSVTSLREVSSGVVIGGPVFTPDQLDENDNLCQNGPLDVIDVYLVGSGEGLELAVPADETLPVDSFDPNQRLIESGARGRIFFPENALSGVFVGEAEERIILSDSFNTDARIFYATLLTIVTLELPTNRLTEGTVVVSRFMLGAVASGIDLLRLSFQLNMFSPDGTLSFANVRLRKEGSLDTIPASITTACGASGFPGDCHIRVEPLFFADNAQVNPNGGEVYELVLEAIGADSPGESIATFLLTRDIQDLQWSDFFTLLIGPEHLPLFISPQSLSHE